MIRKWLDTQKIFNLGLRMMSFFALRGYYHWTRFLTSNSAKLNISIKNPERSTDLQGLAQIWIDLMPENGKEHFKITGIEEDTAYTEIHLHCPLRGSGNVEACHHLMNYDRRLMEKVGGQLMVLESQSNSGKDHCRLAIRKSGDDLSDLHAAYQRK